MLFVDAELKLAFLWVCCRTKLVHMFLNSVYSLYNYRVSQKLQVPPGLSSVWTFSPRYFRLLLWTLWTFSPPDSTLQRLRSDNWNADTRTGYFSQRTNSWPLWNWNRSLSGRFPFTITSSNSRVKAGPHCWKGEVGMSTMSKMGEEWSVRGGRGDVQEESPFRSLGCFPDR